MKTIQSDVIVIGGGIVGTSAALFMSQKGLKVSLLEKHTCGSCSSGVNFGGVRCQGRTVTHLPLAIRARHIWQNFEKLLGGKFEYEVTGHLKLARNESELAMLEDYYQASLHSGLDLQMLSGDQVRKKYPWLSDQVHGGSFSPYDGQANPRIVTPAFGLAAIKAGAEIYEHQSVQHIEHDGQQYHVKTEDTCYQAQKVVLTAGAWSHQLAEQLGETFTIRQGFPAMAVTEPVPYFIRPCLGVQGGDIYIRQVARGNVVFGGGQGVRVNKDSSRVTSENIMALMQRLLSLIPSLKHTQILRTWSGMEAFFPDNTPVIDQSEKNPGLYFGFGFSGGGFELGPGAGAALTDLVIDGQCSTDLSPFKANRFSSGN